MTERLRRSDLALLSAESPTTPMHNATVEIFAPGASGFDHDALVALIDDRIAFVPRYRQRLQFVPARLANPVWVDDPDFDLAFHVRRSALPRPGSMDQLRDLVGRIVSRPLDRHRPLWEVYFIEGLADGRVALLSKSHEILVDGVETVDLGQVLLDVSPEPKELLLDEWRPRLPPSTTSLVFDAVRDSIDEPITALRTARSNLDSVLRGLPPRLTLPPFPLLPARRPVLESPLNRDLSEQRRFVAVRTDLQAYRSVRKEHGGTVNDVILATVTGALRSWLMTRGQSVGAHRSLRAMVPMSVIDDELEPTSLGSQIIGHFVDLPIGEVSPVIRLHQVSYAFKAHAETGRAVAANRLAGIAGFAPTTFHALGSRVAFTQFRKGYNLSITNVPGPQFPLYAAGAEMVETYPVQPLLPGQALAIGVTSYDGSVFYGITADRDALPDIEVFGDCLSEALDELVDSASSSRPRAPRGRKKPRKDGR
jgi:diacylglycerol O-acyltransferase / wax synthase